MCAICMCMWEWLCVTMRILLIRMSVFNMEPWNKSNTNYFIVAYAVARALKSTHACTHTITPLPSVDEQSKRHLSVLRLFNNLNIYLLMAVFLWSSMCLISSWIIFNPRSSPSSSAPPTSPPPQNKHTIK